MNVIRASVHSSSVSLVTTSSCACVRVFLTLSLSLHNTVYACIHLVLTCVRSACAIRLSASTTSEDATLRSSLFTIDTSIGAFYFSSLFVIHTHTHYFSSSFLRENLEKTKNRATCACTTAGGSSSARPGKFLVQDFYALFASFVLVILLLSS